MDAGTRHSQPAPADLPAFSLPRECEGWRAMVEEVLREAADPAWDRVVTSPAGAPIPGVPRLAGAGITLRRGLLGRVRRRWIDAARRCDGAIADTVAACLDDATSARLLEASLDGDDESIRVVAEASGADVEQLESLAYLLPVPLLQACHRRLAAELDVGWSRGFCPLCGSWPAFAEVLGIERARRLRCGRCGAAWYAQPLSCGFCGTQDHVDLVTLVPADALAKPETESRQPEAGGWTSDRGVVEACTRCSGYIKRFTTLQGWPPASVMLQDLASVALDFAAIEEGYARPKGTGHALDVALNA